MEDNFRLKAKLIGVLKKRAVQPDGVALAVSAKNFCHNMQKLCF
jgi:hypothetical protein